MEIDDEWLIKRRDGSVGCPHCDLGRYWVLDKDGSRYCEGCGNVDRGWREFDHSAPPDKPDRWAKVPTKGKISWGATSRGRYKEKFHFNERVAQWCIDDPEIPPDSWARIVQVANSGEFGPPEHFTRSTVISITRRAGLQKYRERWKRILYQLNLDWKPELPDGETLEWLDFMFDQLVRRFRIHRAEMPKSVMRGIINPRHNFLSYNYVQRKLLEVRGIRKFHWEFPVPKSHGKLRILDDVMEKMFEDLDIPFERSIIIKRPKIKRKV